MKKTFFKVAALLSLIAIGYSACKKEDSKEDVNSSDALSLVEENAFADQTFTGIFSDLVSVSFDDHGPFGSMKKERSEKISSGNPNNDGKLGCANLSISPQGAQWPKTVTADYGTGCSLNGVTKKGKIIAVFSKAFRKAGAEIDITFDNFYANGHKIEGTAKITNQGENGAGNPVFTIKITEAKVIGTKTVSWTSNKTIEWTKGIQKENPLDDALHLTGSAEGISGAGKAFTVNITDKLVRPILCPFFAAGIVEIKQGSNTVTLDYGTGSCDNKAVISVNGITKDIELEK